MIDGLLFITYEEFLAQYGNIINFVEFNGIISAIRYSINLARFSENSNEIRILSANELINYVKPQKKIYTYICDIRYLKEDPLFNLCIKWNATIARDINGEELSNHFVYLYKTTISTKLRNFIYKLLQFKLYLNPQLMTINLKNTDQCTFCNCHVETVSHLFFHCNHTNELWATVKQFINTRFNFVLNVASEDIIFPLTSYPLGIRITIYTTLYYIYKCRLLTKLPNKVALIREFYKIESLEFEIAKENEKLYTHKNKWKINVQ